MGLCCVPEALRPCRSKQQKVQVGGESWPSAGKAHTSFICTVLKIKPYFTHSKIKCLRLQWTCQTLHVIDPLIFIFYFSSCLLIMLHRCFVSQATTQTDLENWVTAIHSACASLFAKKLGKEDTVRLLKNQTKSLFQKIDMDGKMKKMAELQLSIVSDPKNRKAIENQVLETIFYVNIFMIISCFGLRVSVLSRPESNRLGGNWHGSCNYCQVSTAMQSSAGGGHSKLFYEHKAVSFLFWKNVITF